jgi:hypothetical protein
MNLAPMFIAVLLAGSSTLQMGRTSKRKSRTPNRPPTIESLTVSPGTVCSAGCENVPVSRGSTLRTVASDPDGDVLTYTYSVPAGSIEGTGGTVFWNLKNQRPGEYRAVVTVEDQKGNKVSAALIVMAAWCELCAEPCPVVSVECPSEVESGKQITFVATVIGGAKDTVFSYSWSSDAGRIVEGEFEQKMTLDMLRFPFEKVTATVRVGAHDPSCINKASCTTRIKE